MGNQLEESEGVNSQTFDDELNNMDMDYKN